MGARSEKLELIVQSSADLERAFGSRGRLVGPRTGPNARTKLEKELWCLRRYLASTRDELSYPLTIEKSESPDFLLRDPRSVWGIEVSEATHPDDQREYTLFERSKLKLISQGEFGGRFAGGACGTEAEQAWCNDIISAVQAKVKRVKIWDSPCAEYVLLLYATGNAKMLADTEQLFEFLHPLNEKIWDEVGTARIRVVEVIHQAWLISFRPREVALRKLLE